MVILNNNVFCSRYIKLDSATAMKLFLSSKTPQNTSIFGRRISKINYNYFISYIKVIISFIAWPNVIYYASVVIKVISVLHPNTGYPAYVITHPIRNMEFPALSESA